MLTPILAAFPHLAPLAAVAARPAPAPSGNALVALGVLLVVAVVAQLLAYWGVSKMLVPEDSEFAKALKLFGLYLGANIGAGVVFVAGIYAANAAHMALAIPVLFVVFAVLGIYILIHLPMQVYSIGIFRAISFVVLAFIIAAVVQVAAIAVLGFAAKDSPLLASMRALASGRMEQQNAVLAGLRERFPAIAPQLDAANERVAADREKPVALRKAALQRMRDVLEARRKALDPKDRAAAEAFKTDAKRYGDLFREVEAAAKAGGAPANSP